MKTATLKNYARIVLGVGLIGTGISHLTGARKAFQAQVPDWVPLKKDDTVVYSGIAEIALGSALVFTKKHQKTIGIVAVSFLAAVFPGNISQFVHKRNAFALDSNRKRLLRLFLQPVLVYWALKSTNTPSQQAEAA